MKSVFQAIAGLVSAVLLASCAAPRKSIEYRGDEPASPSELAKWRSENGVVIASREEVALANKCEARFVGKQARATYSGLRIVFSPGKLVGSGHANLSTTSTYSLLDRHNLKLADGPSCVRSGQTDGAEGNAIQRAWFAPDGKIAVIYEYTNECLGPEPLTIVFYEDQENPGNWRSKFLLLPLCGLGIFDEGAHAKCSGVVGDELLFDANTNDGEVLKMKIDRFQEHYPFPFSIG